MAEESVINCDLTQRTFLLLAHTLDHSDPVWRKAELFIYPHQKKNYGKTTNKSCTTGYDHHLTLMLPVID